MDTTTYFHSIADAKRRLVPISRSRLRCAFGTFARGSKRQIFKGSLFAQRIVKRASHATRLIGTGRGYAAAVMQV